MSSFCVPRIIINRFFFLSRQRCIEKSCRISKYHTPWSAPKMTSHRSETPPPESSCYSCYSCYCCCTKLTSLQWTVDRVGCIEYITFWISMDESFFLILAISTYINIHIEGISSNTGRAPRWWCAGSNQRYAPCSWGCTIFDKYRTRFEPNERV